MEKTDLRVVKAHEQEYDYVIVNNKEITYNSNLYDCLSDCLSHAELARFTAFSSPLNRNFGMRYARYI